MKIAILDDYQDVVRQLDCFSMLGEHEVKVFHHGAVGIGQLAVRLAPFEVLVLIRERTKITSALLKKLPNLKLIVQTGKFSGHVDLDAAQALGIQLREGSGDATAPAELTWALILAASRKIDRYAAHLQRGSWQIASTQSQFNGLGRVLKGRTLGILGYGKIGQLVASYGRVFGMQVLVWGSEQSRARAIQNGDEVADSKESFFQQADVLSLHLRLAEGTRGVVQLSDLLAMKSDALLVNTSRAELIEEGALLSALNQGKPAYAAIDVFENEPLVANHPLLHRENVLATPHLGYVEKDSYELYFSQAFQHILAFSSLEQPSES